MKIKLCIVDDEPHIVSSLEKLIRKEIPQVTLCGSATSGKEALRLLEDVAPDMVLMDISLPDLTGLEIIKTLNQKHIHLNYIILSAYRDFDYAKQAIELGVEEYLVKPIDGLTLRGAIKKTWSKICHVRNQENTMDSYHKMLPELCAHHISSYLHNSMENQQLSNYLRELCFPLENCLLYGLPLRLILPETAGYIKTLAPEFLQGPYLFFTLENTAYIMVENNFTAKSWILSFKDHLNSELKKELSIFESNVIGNLDDFSREYKHMKAQNLTSFYREMKKGIVHIDSVDNGESSSGFYALEVLPKMGEELQKGNYTTAFEELEQWLKLCGDCHLPLPQLQLLVDEVLHIYQQNIVQPKAQLYIQQTNIDTVSLNGFSTLLEVFSGLHRDILGEFEEETTSASEDSIIYKIRTYCYKNYSDNITLDDIANEVNLSKNYLCSYIKKQLGIGFYDYLTNIRMDIAKEELAHTQNRINDIAYATGFSSPSYFGKIFKKVTNMTPLDYRKKFSS